MDNAAAVRSLAALAQPARLGAYRRLVQAGGRVYGTAPGAPGRASPLPSRPGLAAGELAAQVGLSPPALSFHLRALTQAGLVGSRQQGRYVYYFAQYAAMDRLLGFLTDNCCAGADCAPAARRRACAPATPVRGRARPA